MVTLESVEQARTRVDRFSDDELGEEFDRFFRTQPAICDFVTELTSESRQTVQELTLFLAYMVCKAAEMNLARDLAPVASEAIQHAYQENEAWVEKMSEAELEPAIDSLLAGESEPHLLEYVVASISDPQENGTSLADEEKIEVFLALKTIITSLSRSA